MSLIFLMLLVLIQGILHECGGDPMQDIPNNLKTGILHVCGGDPAINWSR